MAEFGTWRYRVSKAAWKGRYWRAYHRLGNRVMDVLAWADHYCNDSPWRPDPHHGSYNFWRCALRRGHDGLHRLNNYVWDDYGRTDYVPIPHGRVARQDGTVVQLPHQPWRRYPTLTMRQQRARRRWHDDWECGKARHQVGQR